MAKACTFLETLLKETQPHSMITKLILNCLSVAIGVSS